VPPPLTDGDPYRPGPQRRYYRQGPDYRHGEDVSFADVRDQFCLAGVQVGRWVSREEQQRAANLVFDALADLAWILNAPPAMLGLRQSLSLAFGSRGSLHAQAHYEPQTRILALAKNAGGGALAHEFWHAFDHHIAAKLYPGVASPQLSSVPTSRFASHLWLEQHPNDNQQYHDHPLNRRLNEIFKSVLLSADGTGSSDYVRRAIALDKALGRAYFSLPTELLARACESFIQDHREITNSYLVSGTRQSRLARQGGYPQGPERPAFSRAFDGYFLPLGQALAARPD